MLSSLLGAFGLKRKDPVEAFVATALAHLHKQRAFTVVAAPGPMTRVVSFGAETGQLTLEFENLWRMWQQPMPEGERQRQLGIWAGSCLDGLMEEAPTPSQLVPLVRHYALAHWDDAMLERANESRPNPPPGRDGPWAVAFTGDLVVMLGLDRPNSLIVVDDAALEKLGVPSDQALALALENLDRLLPEPEITTVEDGLFAINFPDQSWAIPSAMVMNVMLDEILAARGIKTAFVALPARAALLFCDAEKSGTLDLITAAVRHYRTWDHPQSDFIFRMDVGVLGFVPLFTVPETTS